MSTNVGGIYYNVTLDTKGLINGQRETDKRLQSLADSGDKLQSKFTSIAVAIGAALGSIAVDGLLSKLVSVQRQFDILFASLKTASGGSTSVAEKQFERLQKFAAQTPFTLQQSISGFVKLVNLGIDPSERAMRSFGNTASAMGKDLNQMIEAVADASTSEFERLKEFGIKAKVDGDKVKLTFKGISTEVKNNSGEITKYLIKLGEVNFAGAMSDRMKTLDGDISNLGDAWDALFLTVSRSGIGEAIASGVRKATEAIQQAEASVKRGELTDYFSALKPVISAAEIAAVSLAGVLAGKFVGSMVAATQSVLAKMDASTAAAAADMLAARAAQASAIGSANAAVQAQASALAAADLAAANALAARSQLALASAEAERTAAARAQAAGTLAQAVTTQQAIAAEERLTAAKIAEAESNVALATAERTLAAARIQTGVAAAEATAATLALTAVQRVNVVASGLAAAAGRTFLAVVAGLGGPIGIAIVALSLLALNWDKIGDSAKTAAQISEDASSRIRKAMTRTNVAPMRDLMEVRDAAEAEMKRLDAEISRAEEWAKSGRGRWGDQGTAAVDTSDLDAKREAQRAAFVSAQVAIDELKKRQMADAFPDAEKPFEAPKQDISKEAQARKLAAQAYYQSLVAGNLNAIAQIDAEEKKALIDNQKRMVEDKDNAGIYAKAKVEIVKKFARERALLEEKNTQEIAELNIATTTDEMERIQSIRDEEYRRADAEAKLGVRTAEQAERAKAMATFTAAQAFADLAERNAVARADAQQVAITKSQEQQIALVRDEAIRAAETGYQRGKLTFEEAESAKTKAMQVAIDARKALKTSRAGTEVDTLQLKAGRTGGSDDQEKLIRAQAAQALAETERARLADIEASQIYADKKVEIEADMNQKIAQMRANANMTALASSADALGAMVAVLKNSAGEQSGVYKVMFAAQKAFAIASAIVSIQQGLSNAAKLEWPASLVAMGSVISATASIISTIQGTNYGGGRQYGGPVSSGSLYRVNETGRPEMFTAANGSQYMMPTANGNVTPADQVGGGGGQWNFVFNNAPAGSRVTSVDDQTKTVNITIGVISDQIRSNTGQVWSALTSASNVRGGGI